MHSTDVDCLQKRFLKRVVVPWTAMGGPKRRLVLASEGDLGISCFYTFVWASHTLWPSPLAGSHGGRKEGRKKIKLGFTVAVAMNNRSLDLLESTWGYCQPQQLNWSLQLCTKKRGGAVGEAWPASWEKESVCASNWNICTLTVTSRELPIFRALLLHQ